MSDNTDKRTATQRIEDLERVVTMVCNGLNQLQSGVNSLFQAQNEVAMIKEALKILDRKTDGIIVSAATGITFEAVKDYVQKLAIQDLQKQVSDYLANGKLTSADQVGSDSYCVCEEYEADGSLHNPRIQFRMDAQSKETSEALLGKKVGDTASLGDGAFSLKLLEIYTVTPETAPAAPAPVTEQAPAPEAATPAPATEAAPTETAPAAAAPTGPSNANFESAPAETPVAQFVSDAGTVAAPAATA